MKKVVLFDFHNTLVCCDAWLDLEIRTLPGDVLRELGAEGLVASSPSGGEEGLRAFSACCGRASTRAGAR